MFVRDVAINGMVIPVQSDFEMEDGEVTKYAELGYKQHGADLARIEVFATDDPEYVDFQAYRKSPVGFERIRRITGYLVGTLDRFNDAKRAEEADRVKHEV